MNRITCPLSLAAEKYPETLALIQDTKTLSYKELEARVSDIVERLGDFEFEKHERIAIVLPNSISYIIVLFALWRMGLVACPVSTRLPNAAIKKLLKKINCDWIITSPDDVALVSGAPQKKISIWDISTYRRRKPSKPAKKISLNQDAAIFFTSGSTAEPKAALLSYGNLYYNAMGSNENIPFGPADRWLLMLPLYHVGGVGILFRALLGGGRDEHVACALSVLGGALGPCRDIVLLNAAAALWVSGHVAGLNEGARVAASALDGGQALRLVERLRALSPLPRGE